MFYIGFSIVNSIGWVELSRSVSYQKGFHVLGDEGGELKYIPGGCLYRICMVLAPWIRNDF